MLTSNPFMTTTAVNKDEQAKGHKFDHTITESRPDKSDDYIPFCFVVSFDYWPQTRLHVVGNWKYDTSM